MASEANAGPSPGMSADGAKVNMAFIAAIVAVATIGGFMFVYDMGVIKGTQEGLDRGTLLLERWPPDGQRVARIARDRVRRDVAELDALRFERNAVTGAAGKRIDFLVAKSRRHDRTVRADDEASGIARVSSVLNSASCLPLPAACRYLSSATRGARKAATMAQHLVPITNLASAEALRRLPPIMKADRRSRPAGYSSLPLGLTSAVAGWPAGR